MKVEYCHLHLHTEYSMLDSLCQIENLCKEAVLSGMKAMAITDHHNLSGAIVFYRKAREYGIKPIIGVELNVSTIMRDDSIQFYHLIALAKNNLGYTNLLRLISRSNLTNDGLVTRSMLEEYKQGLIILSGCQLSELDKFIVTDYAYAKEIALEYRNIFGHNNYYLELQRIGLPGEEEQIRQKVRLARELNIPFVATNNVHYLKREEAETQRMLTSVQRLSFEEIFPKKIREEYYFKSGTEMEIVFHDLPESIKNTVHIVERCNIFFDFEQRNYPRFPIPDTVTAETFLLNICLKAISTKYDSLQVEEVDKKLKYELKVINQMGYAGYFLIIWDIVSYAKSQGIFITGRGSAVGSLVCYLLGITSLDPLQYKLSFERFLNMERTTLPDIDLDLEHVGRKKMIQYIASKYGEANIAHISIFNPLASLSLIRDVAKAQGWPIEQLGLLARFISHENIHEIDALTNSMEFKKAYAENQTFRKLINTIRKLDGLPRHLTQHPTGLVLAPDSLTNYTPLQYAKDGEVITQYDLQAIKNLGLCKLDLLSVRYLTVIRYTLQLVCERYGLKLTPEQIPLDDHKTYRLLQRGDTIGCFELEGEGIRKMLKQVRPVELVEISFALVLSRIEEVDASMVQNFLARLHEVEEVDYPHSVLSEVLEDTYGIILYQEQVMQIVGEVGGFTPKEAEQMRIAILKKDRLKIAEYKSKFVKGATACGITAAEANYVYDKLYRYARITFCKAHITAYAWLAYLSAYLKTHYPLEYITALLNAHLDVDYRFRRYFHQAKYKHITVLSLDINQSEVFATIQGESIRLGLYGVKGVSVEGANEIVNKRQDGIYKSLEDFIQRVDLRLLHYTTIENLVKAGAFDVFGLRKDMLRILQKKFI